jgi:dephospho-CoA kinase
MLKLVKIAVTGGLASGKSSVCRICQEWGAYVISADEIVHQLLSLNTSVGQQVISLLGSDIVDGEHLNRKKIADKVFNHPEKLKALEKIIHPAVLKEIDNHYEKIKETNNYRFFIAEIPLIYESETTYHFDYILCVMANETICSKRFTQKTGYSTGEYIRRMSFQMPLEEKSAKADFTIVNNGDLETLKNQVHSLLKELHSK